MMKNKNMKTRDQNILAYASRNLRYGGAAFIITAVFISYTRPDNLILLLTPYTGDPVFLGGVMVTLGGLAILLGYSIKRWMDCREQI